MNRLAIRGALLVLALLAGVWLAVGIQDVNSQEDGDAVLAKAQKGSVPSAEVDAALDDYDNARRLSPDETPLIHKGQLLLAAGRGAEARGIALQAVHDEPDSLQAWLFSYAAFSDNHLARKRAKAEILRLNPWFLYVLTRRSPT